MKTKVKLLGVVALLILAVNLQAQTGERKNQPENRQVPSIEERLSKTMKVIENKIEINETQKLIIENAFTDFFKNADKAREEGNRTDKSVMENYEKERDQKVKEVLDQEQYESYLKLSCMLRPAPPRMKQNRKQGNRP